jgi:hypothetical protein
MGMRRDAERDTLLRARLAEAVNALADGSADAFGRLLGYTNGGYVREALIGKKPVRAALIERVHELRPGWFDAALSGDRVTSQLAAPPQSGGVSSFKGAQYALSAMIMPPLKSWAQIMTGDIPELFRVAMPDAALRSTPAGTILLCSKTDSPVFGRGVLVRASDGALHVRRYAQGIGDAWVGEADTPGYAALRSSDGAHVVAAVIARFDGSV